MDGMAAYKNRDRITAEVIEAIADATGTDPLTMTPPLYEVVDTDALDTLYDHGCVTSVEFDYDGHTVVVDGDRTVTVNREEA